MKTFGLIGYPLTHSFSHKYFTDKFFNENIKDTRYLNFPIETIDELPTLLDKHHLSGFNVTIPYKQKIISFLTDADDIVSRIGACNCVAVLPGRKLKGYNTDVYGFKASLEKKLQPYHKSALILGTGGASKAVAFALDALGIPYRFVVRNISAIPGALNYNDLTFQTVLENLLIINCTPVGMYPHVEDLPAIDYSAITARHYLFDLVYNPAMTGFLRAGSERGAQIQNGYEMLVLQAEESWKIWNSQ